MHIILLICKLILFFLSNIGYWEYFRRKSRMNVYFLPAFTISLQITMLFCAGILNCLKVVVFLIFASGIVLAVYYLFTDFKETVCTYLNWGYVFLIVAFCLVMIGCRGNEFTYSDDYSHWAVAVKYLLLTDRYPSFGDSMITFREYPLGSTSYVYFFAKIVSVSESAQMVAQGFMMLCFVLPLFKYVKKYKAACSIFILLFVNYIFGYNIHIKSLMVDTLLPLMGMGTLLFVYSECMNSDIQGKCKGVSALYALPFLCAVIQVKNSGIFFILLACILFCISVKHNKIAESRREIIAMAAPFLSLYFWHMHCSYVFQDFAKASKHAMTIQNYQTVFAEKTWEDIQSILLNVLKFSIGGVDLYYLVLFAAVIMLLSFMDNTEMRKKCVRLLLICAVIYIIYMAGMAGMYLFSMPGPEAANLAGIDRYRKTIFIAIYYLLVLSAFEILSSIEVRKKELFCLAGIYLILIASFTVKGKIYLYPTIFGTSAYGPKTIMEQVIRDNHVPDGASCMVFASPQNAGYMRHLGRYLLWSDNLDSIEITEKSQLKNLKKYEYILICDPENEIIREWVEDNYPEQVGKTAILTVN